TRLKELFDSKEVNASDFDNTFLQKGFEDHTGTDPQTFRVRLLQYLDELDKPIDERVIQYGELHMKERKKDNLVAKESTEDFVPSLEQLDESISLGNDSDVEKILVETVVSGIEQANIGPSYDSCIVSEVHHDTFKNMFAHIIQNHVEPESILDAYMVNENNSNIISDIPNMDPIRDKEEHDYVNDEKQHAFFASLFNNKCEVENCIKDNCEALQTAHTFHTLLPKDDNVNTGKKGLGFEIKNNVENPFIRKKVKELTPSLYNIDEMGKDSLSDHKIISKEELKCEIEKRLKVKQRKSPLSYHGFVYAETQFEKPPKVPLKRKNVNLKNDLEQAELRNYNPNLWKNLRMKYFCYAKHAMLKFEKLMFSKQELNQDEWAFLPHRIIQSHHDISINTQVANEANKTLKSFLLIMAIRSRP
nr:hypothetical protein [Tanacetum cinerariifolium]